MTHPALPETASNQQIILTKVIIPVCITGDDHKPQDPHMQYEVYYLTPDAETTMRALSMAGHAARIGNADDFEEEIARIETDLGLKKHDALDENGKIIPAMKSIYLETSYRSCKEEGSAWHFKEGEPYALFGLAHRYFLSEDHQNQAYDAEGHALSAAQGSLFYTKLDFYRNGKDALTLQRGEVVSIAPDHYLAQQNYAAQLKRE